jgi:hypothetical protein
MASRRIKQIKFFSRCFKATYKLTEHADELIDAIKYRGMLRTNMRSFGTIKRAEQAHHIIPIEALKQCRLVQKAVLAKFDINGTINGIGLSIAKHKNRHAEFDSYNRFIMGQLLDLESRLGPNISRSEARKAVEKFAKEMRGHFD